MGEMQRDLFDKLEARFGPCPAEHDNDYVFHMTVALGRAPYENYIEAHRKMVGDESFQNSWKNREFRFSRLGLLYYDDDNICPGTYFCYRMLDL